MRKIKMMYTREMKIHTASAYVEAISACASLSKVNLTIPTNIHKCSKGLSGTIEDYGDETFELINSLSKNHFHAAMEVPLVKDWWEKYSGRWLSLIKKEAQKAEREKRLLEEEAKREKVLAGILAKLNETERVFIRKLVHRSEVPLG